jgi:hypothetical protein
MPAVLEPELAARILLMLYVGVVGDVDERSVLTADVELITSTCSLRTSRGKQASLWIRIVHPIVREPATIETTKQPK